MQIPSHSMSFTTFSWPAILKRLRQMLLTGCKVEEGINWGINLDKADRSQIKKSLGNYLVLRGQVGTDDAARFVCCSDLTDTLAQGASAADISSFEDPRLYCPLACQPLMVATSPNRLGGCEMTASLLSNSQVRLGRALALSQGGSVL